MDPQEVTRRLDLVRRVVQAVGVWADDQARGGKSAAYADMATSAIADLVETLIGRKCTNDDFATIFRAG